MSRLTLSPACAERTDRTRSSLRGLRHGAPSLPTRRSGKQTSSYAPDWTAQRSRPSTIRMPASSKARCVASMSTADSTHRQVIHADEGDAALGEILGCVGSDEHEVGPEGLVEPSAVRVAGLQQQSLAGLGPCRLKFSASYRDGICDFDHSRWADADRWVKLRDVDSSIQEVPGSVDVRPVVNAERQLGHVDAVAVDVEYPPQSHARVVRPVQHAVGDRDADVDPVARGDHGAPCSTAIPASRWRGRPGGSSTRRSVLGDAARRETRDARRGAAVLPGGQTIDAGLPGGQTIDAVLPGGQTIDALPVNRSERCAVLRLGRDRYRRVRARRSRPAVRLRERLRS